ncbi:hypothetical protein Poli38472_003527 [Pythium oligandrum]|uniref:RWP-RK domain-containing protein n=1 Tax=Pythium oligandrum TaxID=41045 RepID=A0A8K1FFF1_PYTOL|nr:hypothetical protein Poli38472_003527 [Pythium oligandrum]|eukprot:TMW57602.1 hypothetical protein Poli38472_003527 [Pythium oligandrum]
MDKKELEAGLSLLHMLQRDDETTVAKDEGATEMDGLTGSLLLAAAQQVDPQTTAQASGNDFLRRNTQLTSLSRELTLEELRVHFGKPIVEVAKEFGICTTFLKKICRRCGIKRWPHRQIRSLTRTVEMLRQAEANATTALEKMKYANQIAHVEAKKRAVMEDPDSNGRIERLKKSVIQRSASPKKEVLTASATTLLNPLDAVAAAAIVASEGLSFASPQLGSSKPTVDTSISVSVNATLSALSPPACTPTAAATPAPRLGDASVDLRISPSHRKLLTLTKGSDDGRLSSSSLGSLQDQGHDELA